MVSMVSPGVSVREVDLTTVIPSASTSIAAFVGNFAWGAVELPTMVSSETVLVDWFGKPNHSITSTDFLVASTFLSYSGAMRIVRVVDSAARNASSSNTFTSVLKNESQIEDGTFALNNLPEFVARYPSALGNSLKVTVLTEANFGTNGFKSESALFDSKPLASLNEVHVVVTDVDGVFNGTAGAVLERYAFVQTVPGSKKEDGSNNYVQDVVKIGSSYIYVGALGDTFTNGGSVTLAGGADSTAPTDADYEFGWDLFNNQEEQEDISLLVTGAASATLAAYVANIAITRTDCIAFISPSRDDVVGVAPSDQMSNVIAFRNSLNLDTSYAVMDSGWKYIFNKYLDRYEWIPLNGDIAGLCARTDNTNDPWYSPAGYTRGSIKNCIKLAYNPDKTARDELYKNGINPVVNFRGSGPMLYGDKTLQTRPSAFDRINVRRLFIVLERAISRAAKYQLFEFNDPFTRAQFVNIVEPFLREVQARRGIYNYSVIADETNNTPQIIDMNTFVGDIYIQPARSINYIQLSFVAVRTGVDFKEVVGKF